MTSIDNIDELDIIAELDDIKDAVELAQEAGIKSVGRSLSQLRRDLATFYSDLQSRRNVGSDNDAVQEGVPPEMSTDDERVRAVSSSSIGRLFQGADGDSSNSLGRDEVVQLLQQEGLDASDAHVDSIFDRYDVDSSGDISRDEFESFMRVMRGEDDGADPSDPPSGYSTDLSSVQVGTAVIAFFAPDQLWYAATVQGVYPASDGSEHGVIHDKYYWVQYAGYETSESLFAESIRVRTESLGSAFRQAAARTAIVTHAKRRPRAQTSTLSCCAARKK